MSLIMEIQMFSIIPCSCSERIRQGPVRKNTYNQYARKDDPLNAHP
jgi:hypothetical protein